MFGSFRDVSRSVLSELKEGILSVAMSVDDERNERDSEV